MDAPLARILLTVGILELAQMHETTNWCVAQAPPTITLKLLVRATTRPMLTYHIRNTLRVRWRANAQPMGMVTTIMASAKIQQTAPRQLR